MTIYIPIPEYWTWLHTLFLVMYVIGAIGTWFVASFLDAMGAAMTRGKLRAKSLQNIVIALIWPISIPIIGLIGLAASLFG